MLDRPRLCARPGCGADAAATLTFRYAASIVWLDHLGPRDPSGIDLCQRHADRLVPPHGWTSQDRRLAVAGDGRGDRLRPAVPVGPTLADAPPDDGPLDLRARAS